MTCITGISKQEVALIEELYATYENKGFYTDFEMYLVTNYMQAYDEMNYFIEMREGIWDETGTILNETVSKMLDETGDLIHKLIFDLCAETIFTMYRVQRGMTDMPSFWALDTDELGTVSSPFYIKSV